MAYYFLATLTTESVMLYVQHLIDKYWFLQIVMSWSLCCSAYS